MQFHDDPTVCVRRILCKSEKKCHGNPSNGYTSVQGRKYEPDMGIRTGKSKLTMTKKHKTGEQQS
jgi:hypothetical protein